MLSLMHGRHERLKKKSNQLSVKRFSAFLEAYKEKSAAVYCIKVRGELLACALIYPGSGPKLKYIDNQVRNRLKVPTKKVVGEISKYIATSAKYSCDEIAAKCNKQKSREIPAELLKLYAERYSLLEQRIVNEQGSMSAKVREIMVSHELTQIKFAARAGLPQPTVSRILSGGKVSDYTLVAICRAFNLDLQGELKIKAKEAMALDLQRREQVAKLCGNVQNPGELFTRIMTIYQCSPRELAARIGVAPNSINRAVKSGQCPISLVRATEAAFDISSDGLMPFAPKQVLSADNALLEISKVDSKGQVVDKNQVKLTVQTLMREHRLNQSTLANRVGVSQGTISRLLSGDRCSIRLLGLITTIFNVELRLTKSA